MGLFLMIQIVGCATHLKTDRKIASTPELKEFMKLVRNCWTNPSTSNLTPLLEEDDQDKHLYVGFLRANVFCEGSAATELYQFLDKMKGTYYLNIDTSKKPVFIPFGRLQENLEFKDGSLVPIKTYGSGCSKKENTFSCKLELNMTLYNTLTGVSDLKD